MDSDVGHQPLDGPGKSILGRKVPMVSGTLSTVGWYSFGLGSLNHEFSSAMS